MSIEDREGRHPRSLRLTTSINSRLVSLCEHLGVTPNSYLLQAIGKSITADEMHFKIGQSSDDMSKVFKAVSEMMKEDTVEKQLPLDEI